MKQVKFLMVALTVLMGTMVTSCMNGESDPTVGGTFFMKVTSTYPYAFEFSGSSVKYVAVNSDKLLTSDLNSGDIVYVGWSYNSEEQIVDNNTKKINVTVSGVQKLTSHSYVSENKGENYQNATINNLGGNDTPMGESKKILYFDKNTIILPILFLYEKSDVALSKHTFTLVYDNTEVQSGDSEIKFYLRHMNNEDKPATVGAAYKAFDIEEALSHFKETTGKKPSRVVVLTNETNKSGSCSLEDAKKDLQTYSEDYKFED